MCLRVMEVAAARGALAGAVMCRLCIGWRNSTAVQRWWTGGSTDAQTAHPATSRTAPAHQPLGSANAETTPAGAPAAAADRKQRPDATCGGKSG